MCNVHWFAVGHRRRRNVLRFTHNVTVGAVIVTPAAMTYECDGVTPEAVTD